MAITLKRRSLGGLEEDPRAPGQTPPIRLRRRTFTGASRPSAQTPSTKPASGAGIQSRTLHRRTLSAGSPSSTRLKPSLSAGPKFTGQSAPARRQKNFVEGFVSHAFGQPWHTFNAQVQAGFAATLKPVAEAYDFYADKISKATGLGDPEKKRALQILQGQYEQIAQDEMSKGITADDAVSRFTRSLYSGLGQAAIQIPKYVAASTAMAPAGLGALGMGAVEFVEASPMGIKEASTRGAQGAAFQQYVKAISLLPRSIQLPTAYGTFAGATMASGGTLEEANASGIIGVGLSMLGRAPTMAAFRSRYAKDRTLLDKTVRRTIEAKTLNDYRAWRHDARKTLDKYKDTKILDAEIRSSMKEAGRNPTDTEVVAVRSQIRNVWAKQVSDANLARSGGLKLFSPRELIGIGRDALPEAPASPPPKAAIGPYVAPEPHTSPRKVMLRFVRKGGAKGMGESREGIVRQPPRLEDWFWNRMSEAEQRRYIEAQKTPLHPAPTGEVAPEFRFTGKEIRGMKEQGRPVPKTFPEGAEPIARREFPTPPPPLPAKFTGKAVERPPLTQTGQFAPHMAPGEIYKPRPPLGRFEPKTDREGRIVVPRRKLEKRKSLIQTVKEYGGIDPEKARAAGYGNQSFKEFGLISALKKGGPGLDDIAKSLVEEGIIKPNPNENPSDALMRTLQYERGEYMKAAEKMEEEYDREYAEWLKENPDAADEVEAIEKEVRAELSASDWEEEIDIPGQQPAASDTAQKGFSREGQGDVLGKEPPAQPGKPAVDPSGVKPEQSLIEEARKAQEEGKTFDEFAESTRKGSEVIYRKNLKSIWEQAQKKKPSGVQPKFGTLREVGEPKEGVWIREMDMVAVPKVIKKHGDFDVLIRYGKRPDERIKASEFLKRYNEKTLRPKGDDTIVGVFVIRSKDIPPGIADAGSEEEAAYGSQKNKNEAVGSIADDLRNVRSTRALRLRAVSQYAKEFKKRGFVDFRGREVKDSRDIAELASTFRHPKAEHFQAIYLKSGKIVAHRVLTSGAPDYVAVTQKLVHEIESSMRRLGADEVYFAHNHPTGNPQPSKQDLQFTAALRKRLGDKFKGHVIVNDTQYTISTVRPWEILPDSVYDVDTRFVNFARPKVKLAPPGEQIMTVQKMAGFVKDFVKKGRMTVVFSDGRAKVLSVDNVGAQKNIREYIKQKMRAYGAVSYAIAFRKGDSVPSGATNFPLGLVDVIRIESDGSYSSMEEGTIPAGSPGAYVLSPPSGVIAKIGRERRGTKGVQEEPSKFTGKARRPGIPEFENSKQAIEFGAAHFKDEAMAQRLRVEYESRRKASGDDLEAKHKAGLYREAAEVAEGQIRPVATLIRHQKAQGKESPKLGKITRSDLPKELREEPAKFTGKAKVPKPAGQFKYTKPRVEKKKETKKLDQEEAIIEISVVDDASPRGTKKVKRSLKDLFGSGGFFNVPMDPTGNFPSVDPDFLRQPKKKTTILQYWTPTEYHLKQLGFDQKIGQPVREALQDFSIELAKKGDFVKQAQSKFYKQVDARNKVLSGKGKKRVSRKQANELVWQMMDKGIPDDVNTPEAELARTYRKETEEMLRRMNEIRPLVGQEEIKGLKNYVLHMLRPEFLNEIYGRGVIPTELAKIMDKIPPKKVFLRTAEHRKGIPEEWLVKDPHRLMHAMYAIDLRYVHLQKVLAEVQPYLDAVKDYRGGSESHPDEWSPETYKYLDDWIKQAVKMRPSNLDVLIENLIEYTVAPLLRKAGLKVSHMPWRDFVSLLSAASHTGALGMRLKPILRNLVQSTFDWVMYGTKAYMKGSAKFLTPGGWKVLKESKIWRTRMPYEAQDRATLNKIFSVGGVAYRMSDLHNVGKGILTRYYYARDRLGHGHKKAIKWADTDLAATQWSYRREDLPRAYWTTTGRFVWNLGSWWMNFYTRLLPEITLRTFRGVDVTGRKVPVVERLAGLRFLILIGVLYGLRAGSKELTGTVVDYTGQVHPTPARTSPMFQLAQSTVLISQGLTDNDKRKLNAGLRQLANTGKIFIPFWLGAQDIYNLVTEKKQLRDVAFYGRQSRPSQATTPSKLRFGGARRRGLPKRFKPKAFR